MLAKLHFLLAVATLVLALPSPEVIDSDGFGVHQPPSDERIIGDAHVNRTTVVYPSKNDWWTLGETNVVEWWWGFASEPQMQVQLRNSNKTLLNYDHILADNVEARMLSVCTKKLEVGDPGPGYYIALTKHTNGTFVLAFSERFDIRPAGAQMPILPAPYGLYNRQTANTAGRLSVTRLVLVAFVMACLIVLMR